MPVMNGLEAVARMEQIDPQVPVLFLSARASEYARTSNGYRWLSKPFAPAQLVESVQAAVSARAAPARRQNSEDRSHNTEQ
jgi:CheY-like chemotaxis protein